MDARSGQEHRWRVSGVTRGELDESDGVRLGHVHVLGQLPIQSSKISSCCVDVDGAMNTDDTVNYVHDFLSLLNGIAAAEGNEPNASPERVEQEANCLMGQRLSQTVRVEQDDLRERRSMAAEVDAIGLISLQSEDYVGDGRCRGGG